MASKQTKRQRDLERREKAEALRRRLEAEERRRRRFVLIGSLLAVAAVAAAVVLLAQGGKPKEPGSGPEVVPLAIPGGKTTTEPPATVVPDSSGIEGVVAYDSSGYPTGSATKTALPHLHVLGPVVYSVTPPVGGDHYGVWMNCGIYDKPVPNERAVHNLEHGAVWITYRPSLGAADVTALRTLVLKQTKGTGGNRYMDLSPWSDDALPAPIVVTAWAHQLPVQSPSDPRIQAFIDAFRTTRGLTPELGSGAPCNGVRVDEGGRPALS